MRASKIRQMIPINFAMTGIKILLKLLIITLMVLSLEHIFFAEYEENPVNEIANPNPSERKEVMKEERMTKSRHVHKVIDNLEDRKFDPEAYKFTKRSQLKVDVRPKIILGPKGDYEDAEQFEMMGKIPLIIHQTYKDAKVPIMFKKWIYSWMKIHPHMQYWFWTDEDIKHFISTRFPNFMDIFDHYTTNIHRADVFRYFVMYEFGGVYADMDMECLQPLDEMIIEKDCILSLEHKFHRMSIKSHEGYVRLVSNAFMACHPRHPFFVHTIGFLAKRGRRHEDTALKGTGSLMLEESYAAYEKIQAGRNLPFIADAEYFQPKYDPKRFSSVKDLCEETVKHWDQQSYQALLAYEECAKYLKGYATFDNVITSKSLAVHHFTRLWDPKGNETIQLKNTSTYFNIMELAQKQST